jgi:hypothetical protein
VPQAVVRTNVFGRAARCKAARWQLAHIDAHAGAQNGDGVETVGIETLTAFEDPPNGGHETLVVVSHDRSPSTLTPMARPLSRVAAAGAPTPPTLARTKQATGCERPT